MSVVTVVVLVVVVVHIAVMWLVDVVQIGGAVAAEAAGMPGGGICSIMVVGFVRM